MIVPTRIAPLALLLGLGAATASAQCLEVRDDKAAPSVAAPTVDARQIVRLTQAGLDALKPFESADVYIEVTRESGVEDVAGKRLPRLTETFVRMLQASERKDGQRETPFTFSRAGSHTIRLFAATAHHWPKALDLSDPRQVTALPQCDLSVQVLRLPDLEDRRDFPGVRGQWWGAYRIPAKLEVGGSVFVQRLGFALSAQLDTPRTIGDRELPANRNAVTGAFEVRWRGSRGYLGGGVRYYPDDEPGRDAFRFGAVAGEELPSFKGRPFWLLVDLSLQERRKNALKGLSLTFGLRFDLWGSQP